MTLTIAQADLVKGSYARIAADPVDFSTLFYHRLFERHPFVRSLFPTTWRRRSASSATNTDAP
ncbi:hypothetical protein AB5I41_18390 [Sphingomonas sp. MMS24-JH45]